AARGPSQSHAIPGRAFELRFAMIFALTITAILFVAAFLADRYGSNGATLGIALAGFADAHSASASAARLLATGALHQRGAVVALSLAVATNSVTKIGVAWKAGGGAYVRALAPGIVLMLAALAAGVWLQGWRTH